MYEFDNSLQMEGVPYHLILYFLLDQSVQTTTRTNYNLVDVLANTGGFASVITLAFTLLSRRIQKALYQLTVIRKYLLYVDEEN